MSRSVSIWLSAILVLVPLSFAPGVFLYYDITPKILVVCLGAAGLVFFSAGSVNLLTGDRVGRRMLWLMALMAGSLLLSTVVSTSPAGSVSGSTWRRFGLPVQLSLLLFFLVAVAALARSAEARKFLLRSVAISSLLVCGYAILQYLELDPFIQGQLYSVGQYNQPILRPPGTTGSTTNLANYALMTLFLSLALWKSESTRSWRLIGLSAAGLAVIAVFLSGTRAALFGLAVAIAYLAIRNSPRITRPMILAAGLAALVLAGFYVSPVGSFLRNRTLQAWGDWKGGTRLWLWRDSVRMASSRPIAGYGLDTFASEFPRFQSEALSAAYPDSYNESPHNFLLDVLLAQGLIGLVPLAGILWLAFSSTSEQAVRAGMIGLLVSLQFFCLEITTAIYLYFALAMIVASQIRTLDPIRNCPFPIRLCQVWASCLVVVFGVELAAADHALEQARQALSAGHLAASVIEYERGRRWFPLGFNSSLWYSKSLLGAAQRQNQVPAMLDEISSTALDAHRNAEDRHNACYHLAMVYGSRGQLNRADEMLSECIRMAPTWYVLYWSAALTEKSLGNSAQAEQMAIEAVRYSGKHREEMTELLDLVRNGEKK